MDVDTVCGEGVEARLEVLPVPHPGLPQLDWAAISGQDAGSSGDGGLHSTIRACEAWRRPVGCQNSITPLTLEFARSMPQLAL
jgi:hypothetical protein